jgi:hypothetical protein
MSDPFRRSASCSDDVALTVILEYRFEQNDR